MKRLFVAILVVSATISSCSQKSKYASSYELKNSVDTISYCLGTFEAKSIVNMFNRTPLFDTIDYKQLAKVFDASKITEEYLKQRNLQFDTISEPALRAGFVHQLSYGKAAINEAVAEGFLNAKFEEVRAKRMAEREKLAQKNKEDGEAFLAENAKKEGVVTTESGLQYKVLVAGNGPIPGDQDNVKVHYTGRLIDGTVFDSSVGKDPLSCNTRGGLIKGWLEALKLMPVGSKWEIYVPANLGYGERGGGDKIGPNSTLIFEMELLEIVGDPAKK